MLFLSLFVGTKKSTSRRRFTIQYEEKTEMRLAFTWSVVEELWLRLRLRLWSADRVL